MIYRVRIFPEGDGPQLAGFQLFVPAAQLEEAKDQLGALEQLAREALESYRGALSEVREQTDELMADPDGLVLVIEQIPAEPAPA